MSGHPRGSEYERQLREFREALDGGSIGVSQAGELTLLETLIRRYPDQAAEYLARIRGAT